jgi:predicted phage terminase large subunit-like protein
MSEFQSLANSLADSLEADWRSHARPSQLPPPGDWSIWLLLAGRGFGKTRVLSEWVLDQVQSGARRIALVAATSADARDVVIEGDSGILSCAPRWNRPEYEPTKRRLTWPNGAIATAYSADEPERLRGPQFDAAVCDELGAWRYPEAWDMLMLGLRLGKNPRCVVATTPKPTRLIRDLVSREGKDTVITRGRTKDNEANLAPQFLKTIVARFAGTRLGRQELDGELLTDTPGALWSAQNLEETRVPQAPPLSRIVIGIDPSGGDSEGADECGIVVAGLGLTDGHGYVLSDLSGRYAPPEWARRAVDAYRVHRADKIVAEVNYGGQMVLATIAAIDPNVPCKAISSSRGKVLRAEPISTLSEQGRVHLVGTHPELEDTMTSFTADWSRARDGSPDRVDALVFALTELMCDQPASGYFPLSSLLSNGAPVETPEHCSYVIAVAATPGKSGEQLGTVYLAIDEHRVTPWPATIVDWDLRTVDDALFEKYLPSVYKRLDSLALECSTQSAGLWLHGTSGVSAALLQQATERGFNVNDIDDKVEWAAAPLADRAAAASRHLHTGRRVKIAKEAFDKLIEFRGFTRNHLLAEYSAFRIDQEMASDGLLRALLSSVLISLDDSRVAFDVEIEEAPAAPPPPIPLPPPHILLKPGAHNINGAMVDVPPDGDKDLVAYPLPPGRHIIDSKITYVHAIEGGFRVF